MSWVQAKVFFVELKVWKHAADVADDLKKTKKTLLKCGGLSEAL